MNTTTTAPVADRHVDYKKSRLMLEVQQCPQLEAGVRDGELDVIVPCLLPRIRHVGVLVNVENTPHFVIGQEGIAQALRVSFCLFFLLGASLDQSLRDAAAVINLHVNQ